MKNTQKHNCLRKLKPGDKIIYFVGGRTETFRGFYSGSFNGAMAMGYHLIYIMNEDRIEKPLYLTDILKIIKKRDYND